MKSLIASTLSVVVIATNANADNKVDFAKDIQPIFQKSCVECHGADKHKGDLRLDLKEAALKGSKDGPVIVPGQADKSELYHRITLAPGSDDIMPSKGDPLTKAQTDLIRDWINQGAIWPDGATIKATETAAQQVKLPDYKPGAEEQKAVATLEKAGVSIRPVAVNMNWRECSFRALGTNATDAAIAPVKDVLGLLELNLGGTKVTDNGLAAVKGLTNLTHLHLEHTKITDAGLANLKNLSNLSYLNLFDTAVSDAGLENLKGLKNLKHLYVWQTKVSDAGVTALKKDLPNVEVFKGWDLTTVAKVEATKSDAAKAAATDKPEGKKRKKKK